MINSIIIPYFMKWISDKKYKSPKEYLYGNSKLNIELINNINIEKAYIIHFKFKSTEEYVKKIKRGYHGWTKSYIYHTRIKSYFKNNKITEEKIKYFEKELKINLSNYKIKIKKRR